MQPKKKLRTEYRRASSQVRESIRDEAIFGPTEAANAQAARSLHGTGAIKPRRVRAAALVVANIQA
jgi:hypothetical protein